MLVQHERGCLAQMIDAARELGERANIVAVEEVPHERVDQYGVVGVGEQKGKLFSITSMVEKPPRERAPSNLILTGRYILQPEILDILAKQDRGAGGEIQLTDAMIELSRTQPFYGLKFDGRSFDCGSKIGFLAANVSYALAREDIAPGFPRRDQENPRLALPAQTEQNRCRSVGVARLRSGLPILPQFRPQPPLAI